MIRISVCMATFNGEKFVEKQLSSILSQLGQHDEVIISDDGSVDDTLVIINKFADSRIKVFLNKKRYGPVGNFENALRHASGELIFLSDQDDVWLSGKVSTVSSLLKNNDLVLTNCKVVDEFGNLLSNSFFDSRNSKKGFWINLYRNSYIGCCMAFRRDILSYVLPFPHFIHMHDWWIGLLVEAKGNIAFCQDPMIMYVRHGGNASPTGEVGYSFPKQLANRFFLLVNVSMRILA